MAAGVDRTRRTFLSYIDKTREYYLAQGFDNPYRWAYFDHVPFTPLSKPLSECRLTLIATASEMWPENEERPPKHVYSIPSNNPPERLYTQDLSWDKEATHTDDLDSYFPIHRLQEFVKQGRVGSLAPRCHGVPTEYSQRQTMQLDAPEVLRRCQEDGADAAVLVPL